MCRSSLDLCFNQVCHLGAHEIEVICGFFDIRLLIFQFGVGFLDEVGLLLFLCIRLPTIVLEILKLVFARLLCEINIHSLNYHIGLPIFDLILPECLLHFLDDGNSLSVEISENSVFCESFEVRHYILIVSTPKLSIQFLVNTFYLLEYFLDISFDATFLGSDGFNLS